VPVTQYLRLDDILAACGSEGVAAVRPNLARAALNAPAAMHEGEECHPGIPLKAAVLFSRLARSDAFLPAAYRIEGARRCLELFLMRNGFALPHDANAQGLFTLLHNIADGQMVEEGLAFWLQQRIVRGVPI